MKLQEGVGDALTPDDPKKGIKDYVLWSTFCPECLDVDDTLEMKLLDGGMLMFKSETLSVEALPECYATAFDKPYEKLDVEVLFQEN
ncbi:MAG: hypothetical protein ACI4RD_03695 [Kiritimatiellia bacterium]